MSGRDLPAPPAALFPDQDTRTRVDDRLTRALNEAGERVGRGSVMPTLDRAAFRRELAQFDFAAPRALDELLDWTIERLEHGVVHMNHPRYFGLFNPAANFPSQCADRIAGSFNPQLASSGSSPAPVEIEAHVIRAVARRAGLPEESVGHFTTSGSEANYTALLCALTRASPRFESEGVRAFGAPVAMYTSRECQPAWFKIVHQAGIGRDALRLIGTDGQGRLDARDLTAQIAADRARGVVPVLISSTAGTTGAGMIDPLAECARIGREHQVWHHVDAAWGGAALASERLRKLLTGIELADSVTIDAHKWFATTMGCGMFITRDPTILSDTFKVDAAFMPSSVSQLDPYLTTVQWSRRFLGTAAVPVARGGGLAGVRRARGARGRSSRVSARAARGARLGRGERFPAGRPVCDAAGRLPAHPRHCEARARFRPRLGGREQDRRTRGHPHLRDPRGDLSRGRRRARRSPRS